MVDSVGLRVETGCEGRSQLWSLYDMLQFYAAPFVEMETNLGRTIALFAVGKMELTELQKWFHRVTEELNKLPVSGPIRSQAQRLGEYLDTEPLARIFEHPVIISRLNEFLENILDELRSLSFMAIPADRKVYFEQGEPSFGNTVQSQFPDAAYDIEHATRCLALDEWTGSVFHAMRAIEKALHYLAGLLEVSVPGGIEYNDWGPLVDQMEKKIEVMRQLPKGAEKAEQLRFYSELAANFRYFKDGWRNPVSHSRSIYDEHDAQIVWSHAQDFMRALADHRASLGITEPQS
jgi:hypothetical protein